MFGTDLPEAWLSYADHCYVSTRLLWFTGFKLEAPVHAHRTVELYLKTFLVAHGHPISPKEVWGHDLDKLRVKCSEINADFSNADLTKRIQYFQRYFDLVRYPTEIEDALSDGTMIWFSWEDNIAPLDEMVAFTRPRIPLSDWDSTLITRLTIEPEEKSSQYRALHDSNQQIAHIACNETHPSKVSFDSSFTSDLPGC